MVPIVGRREALELEMDMKPSNGFLMRNSSSTESMMAMLTRATPHGLEGPCVLTGLHELRAVTTARQPIYAVFEHPEEIGDHDDACDGHTGHQVEKKRRLTNEQVKSLERSFEGDSKLEPERKNQLAFELGLQPRQVAVWFQNRRARCKTKQLEQEYGVLKVQYQEVFAEKRKLEAEVTRLQELLGLRSKRLKQEKETSEEEGEGDEILTHSTTLSHGKMNNEDVAVTEQINQQQQQTEVELSCGTGQSELALDASSPDIEQQNHGSSSSSIIRERLILYNHPQQQQPMLPFQQAIAHVKVEEDYEPEELYSDYLFTVEDQAATLYFDLATEA